MTAPPGAGLALPVARPRPGVMSTFRVYRPNPPADYLEQGIANPPGGIANSGKLTVSNVTVSDNSATDGGVEAPAGRSSCNAVRRAGPRSPQGGRVVGVVRAMRLALHDR